MWLGHLEIKVTKILVTSNPIVGQLSQAATAGHQLVTKFDAASTLLT